MRPQESLKACTEVSDIKVWHYNQKVYHYRLAVWDGLAELGKDRYELTVFGQTEDGAAFGGGHREYIRHVEVVGRRLRGAIWEDAAEQIMLHKPDVVIFNSTPRYASSWTLPKLVRSYGGVTIAWTKSHSYAPVPAFMLQAMKRRLYKRYDYFVAYGEETRREMLGLGVKDQQIVVAQNTIDTRRIFEVGDEYRAQGQKLKATHGLRGKKILLDIGRMEPAKRHDDVINAWPKLRELDPDLVLVLVSGGPSLDEYRALAKQVDPDRIKVLGRVPIGDDYAWIAASDITIQCGAVGLAINQSMAFGIPTVIADQKGVDTELIVDRKTGWRFSEGDLNEMVRVVKHVLDHPEECQSVVDTAKVKIRDEANIVNMYREIDRCISLAIECRNVRKKS